jgi:hypothetical protein
MIDDIIPFVQANYRVKATPEARALSGLSMGGIQTLNTGAAAPRHVPIRGRYELRMDDSRGPAVLLRS